MPAPKGNQFWKVRATSGRDKIFSSVEELWDSCVEYFEWCDENPWLRNEPVKAGEHFGESVYASISRPYTITGLCVFLGIGTSTWNDYKNKYEEFSDIITRVEEIVYTQKFEGAAVGAFNANIIARDLGLSDKKEIKQKEVPTSKEDLERELERIRAAKEGN